VSSELQGDDVAEASSSNRAATATLERVLPWLIGVAVLLRVTWPFAGMQTHIDEGGWPLAVRQFATEGIITFDFHKAPLYHLMLGVPFAVFPPTLLTGRIVSVLLSLLTAWQLARLVERVGPKGAGMWAALLWLTCFPASDLAGRALIEPFQICITLAVMLAMTSERRHAWIAVTIATAALLLTKANAALLLPPLLLGALWDRDGRWRSGRQQQFVGFALGVLLAAATFGGLYLWDPETFRFAWGSTVLRDDVATPAGALRFGRIVLDPRSIVAGLGFVAWQTPILALAGTYGAWSALRARNSSGFALALAAMTAFVVVQAAQPHQYFALLYPLLAVLAALALRSLVLRDRRTSRWVLLVLILASADGIARDVITRSLAPTTSHGARERHAVVWMRDHLPRDERVVAAPYLLMQLRNPVQSVFELTDFRAPLDSAAIAAADWIVVDVPEWEGYVAKRGRSITSLRDEFASCCDAEYADEFVRVYRVRRQAPTADR
jgi:hypothetical protein